MGFPIQIRLGPPAVHRRPCHRLPAALLIVAATLAHAAVYENSILIDNEDDLIALEQQGDISAETRDALLELFREGVDLNTANREALYDLPSLTYADCDAILALRKSAGRIDAPQQLVSSGALTQEQLAQISPFIRLEPAARPKQVPFPIKGSLRAVTAFSTYDTVPPPALFSARLAGPRGLSGGLMLLSTRRVPESPLYDAFSDGLMSSGFDYRLTVPRFEVQWRKDKLRVTLGTFTLGFAERLTLDNTSRQTPRGIYITHDFTRPTALARTCKLSNPDLPLTGDCAANENDVYITSDFTLRQTFRGIAASLEDLSLGGEKTLSAYGFVSYQERSLYQYQLFDRRFCDDPRDERDSCKAPPVFLPDRSTRLVSSTLPSIFDEVAGGGHLAVRPSNRLALGATGYGALPLFRAQPMQLDFQEWSRYPSGGAFGAIGLDAQANVGRVNLFLEAARTFDAEPGGGGGYGVEQRTTFSPRGQQLELSLRYYDDLFANPFSRAVSAPDQQDGLRARNELGAQLSYFTQPARYWEVKTRHNFWVTPYAIEGVSPAGVANLYSYLRVDFTRWQVFQPAIWFDMRNQNLESSQHGACASTDETFTEADPFMCSGDMYRASVRLDSRPNRRLSAAVSGWLTWRDDVRYKDAFRQDAQVWGEVRLRPFESLALRIKSRWLFEDISDNTSLEQSLWSFIEASVNPTASVSATLRYDLYVWLDERSSTLTRLPSPEHRFMVDLSASF